MKWHVFLTGGMTPTPSGSHGDEASSDSAVSMGSVGSPDQVGVLHFQTHTLPFPKTGRQN